MVVAGSVRNLLVGLAAAWALLGSASARVSALPPDEPNRPSLAVFGRTGLPIDRHFHQQGWHVRELQWGQEVTTADLQKTHVVILATHPQIVRAAKKNDQFEITPEYHTQLLRSLDAFAAGGGGVLVYQALWPTNSLAAVNETLRPWGAQFLDEEILDPRHAFTQPDGMRWTWLTTTNVAAHPCTALVKAICYPTQDVYGPANSPLKVEDSWAVLVRGMQSASSHPTRLVMHKRRVEPSAPGTFAAAPPLAAISQRGKGRIAAFGWCPTHTYFNYQHFMVDDIHFTAREQTNSDGLRLLEQTVQHLAEPAFKAGYGGYREDPKAGRIAPEPPLDWSSLRREDSPTPWRRGVIGARSRLTGGTGTPAEYAVAAKAAGLDFVAFLEDMTKLTPQAWDRFREECRDASSAELLVVPGFIELRGNAETEYFFVGDGPLPPADMRSPDGRTVENYLYAHFAMGVWTHGPFNVGQQRTPPWISRAYTAQSVAYTAGGKTILEPAPYLYNVGIQDAPRPVAVDRIDSPAHVAAAARRYLTLRQAASTKELVEILRNPDRGGVGQVSNGPVIDSFSAVNGARDSLGRNAAGRERFQIRLLAKSAVPLHEARVFNGSELYRRLRLDGTSCDLAINGVHDRQYMFTAVVSDERGGLAICGPLEISDYYNRRTMCSDRQNSIGVSLMTDESNNRVEIDSCIDHAKFLPNGVLPGVPGNAATVGWVPWYWDGSPGPAFHGDILNAVSRLPRPKSADQPTLVHRMMFPLGSRDVIVQSAATEGICDKPPASQEFTPVAKLPYRAETRLYEFKKRPDGPASMLVEGYYEMLEDIRLEAEPWLYESRISHPIYHCHGSPGAAARWSVFGSKGQTFLDQAFPPKDREFNRLIEVPVDGYAAFSAPHSSLALFPLDQPLGCWLWLHDQNWLRGWVGLQRPGAALRKGDTLPYRFVVYTGRTTAPTNWEEIKEFQKDFGLGGKPTFQVTVDRGEVVSTRYALELKADDHAFSGMVHRAMLPHALPVMVHGVRPEWTCIVVDRSSHEWRPIGTLSPLRPLRRASMPDGDMACVALDLGDDQSVWIGNPILSSHPGVRLTFFSDGKNRLQIELHNPTMQDIETTIRSAVGCPLLTLTPTNVRLEPRSSKVLDVP